MEYYQKVCSYSPLLDNVDLVAVKVCFFFDNAESARLCQMQGFLPLHKNKLLPVERHGVLWVKGRFENKDKKGLGGGSAKEDDPFFYLDHHQQHTSSTHYTHTDTLHIPWQHQVGFHWQPPLLLYLLFLHVRLPILDLIPVTKSYSLVIVSLVLKQKSSRNTILLLGIPDAGKTAIYTRVCSIQDVYGIC